MKSITYISLGLFLILSCQVSSEKKNESDILQPVEETEECSYNSGKINLGMEPIEIHDSPSKFINIIKAFKSVDSTYFRIKIEFEELPDSIEYNNPNISEGYAEYGMDIVFRNMLDSINRDNIVVALSYNNYLRKTSQYKSSTFKEFIEECEFTAYQVSETLHDDIYEPLKHEGFDMSNARIEIEGNWMIIQFPKSVFCGYYEDYFENGFMVKACHNNSNTKGDNNYYTNMVNSDSLIRHNFMYDSSRLVDKE